MLKFNYTDTNTGVTVNNVLAWVQNPTASLSRNIMSVPVALLISPTGQSWNNNFSFMQVNNVPYDISSSVNIYAQAYTWLQTNASSPLYQSTTYLSPMNSITTYSIDGVSGSISGTAISVRLPSGTPVTDLVAIFATNGASSVAINSVDQVSGTTANDFTNPVSYLVTAQDSTTQTYTVTVTIGA